MFWRACLGYVIALEVYVDSHNRRLIADGEKPDFVPAIENRIPLFMSQVSEVALSPDCEDEAADDISVTQFFKKVHKHIKCFRNSLGMPHLRDAYVK